MTIQILADYPARTVLGGDFDIHMTEDKGYVRVCPVAICIKSFKRTRPGYEWLSTFTIGCDGDNPDEVFAFGNGAMLTAEKVAKETCLGYEIGDQIKIEGKSYTIREDWNNNIKFEAA